jgi:uncharacterized membrane protein YkvA (DUF1232 family)
VDDVLLATLLLAVAAFLILLFAAGYIAWRVYRSDDRSLARRIGRLSMRNKLALGRALFGDRRVSVWAKLIAIALAVYLASPLDIIPDFIPVLGVLDDLVIVLVGVGLLLRAVPREVVEDHVRRFERRADKGQSRKDRYEQA